MRTPPVVSVPLFTRAEALAAGHTADAIRHRLETGTWRRLRRGIYVAGAASATDPTSQFALRVAAVRCLNVPSWAAH